MSLTRQRELLVLATLGAHPMHGYALAEVLEQGLGPAVDLKRATIYAILNRFEARGWLQAADDQDGGRPPRAVFSLTEAGRAGLPGLAVEAMRPLDSSPLPLAAVIAHLDLLPTADRRQVLQAHVRSRERRLADLVPFAGHPGFTGTAVELMNAQLQLELRVLGGLVGDLGD